MIDRPSGDTSAPAICNTVKEWAEGGEREEMNRDEKQDEFVPIHRLEEKTVLSQNPHPIRELNR